MEGDRLNAADDERRNYIFSLTNGTESIDSSMENCPCHPDQLTFGRLLNFERKGKHCNLVAKKHVVNGLEFVLFVTARRVEAFEELRYYYGGCSARDFDNNPEYDEAVLPIGDDDTGAQQRTEVYLSQPSTSSTGVQSIQQTPTSDGGYLSQT